MIEIAICDDSKVMRDKVKNTLLTYSFQNDFDCKIDEFSTGEEFLHSTKDYHLLILDYQFDDDSANGIETAKRFRKYNSDTFIIFLSSYPMVALQSFEVDTFRFLVKPLKQEELFSALDAFRNKITDNNVMLIHTDEGNLYIKTNQIMYLEAFNKQTLIYTKEKMYVFNETLSSAETKLPPKQFFRCHRSFCINFAFTESFNSKEITLTNGKKIPLSKRKQNLFTNELGAYMTGDH